MYFLIARFWGQDSNQGTSKYCFTHHRLEEDFIRMNWSKFNAFIYFFQVFDSRQQISGMDWVDELKINPCFCYLYRLHMTVSIKIYCYIILINHKAIFISGLFSVHFPFKSDFLTWISFRWDRNTLSCFHRMQKDKHFWNANVIILLSQTNSFPDG